MNQKGFLGKLFFGSVALLLLSCQSPDPDRQIEEKLKQGKPVLKIGSTVIHQGQFDVLAETVPGFRQMFASPEGRKKALSQIIEQEIFLQKSREEKLREHSTRLGGKIWLQSRSLEAGEYLNLRLDQATRERYEKDKDLYAQVEIADLVLLFDDASEAKRQATLQRMQELGKKLTPENFATMAATHSEDAFGRAQQGKIGAVSKLDRRVQDSGWGPLVDRAFQLSAGEIAGPIVTKEGVHWIQALAPKKVRSYEEVAPMLILEMESEMKEKLLKPLLAKTKVEYLDPSLRPIEE